MFPECFWLARGLLLRPATEGTLVPIRGIIHGIGSRKSEGRTLFCIQKAAWLSRRRTAHATALALAYVIIGEALGLAAAFSERRVESGCLPGRDLNTVL